MAFGRVLAVAVVVAMLTAACGNGQQTEPMTDEEFHRRTQVWDSKPEVACAAALEGTIWQLENNLRRFDLDSKMQGWLEDLPRDLVVQDMLRYLTDNLELHRTLIQACEPYFDELRALSREWFFNDRRSQDEWESDSRKKVDEILDEMFGDTR